jgi:hypothetical protein
LRATNRTTSSSSQHIPAASQAHSHAHAVQGNGGAAATAMCTTAAGLAYAQGPGVGSSQEVAGVTQLLGDERTARVDPSDQQAATQPPYGSTVVAGWQPLAATANQARRNAFSVAAGQQQLSTQEQRATHLSAQQAAGEAARSHARRPSSPMAHAHSAPPAASMLSDATAGQPGAASGYNSPFRGTLSTVPSSVLLNVELEGNISEAALQRLAMIEAEANRVSCDAVDASLASMDGVSHSHTGWLSHWQHRRPQQQQQPGAAPDAGQDGQRQQQQHEEPPSEAECRLAYVRLAGALGEKWCLL